MSDVTERIAKAICGSRHGGYQAYAEDRAKDPNWHGAMNDARSVLNEVARLLNEMPAHEIGGSEYYLASDLAFWMLGESQIVYLNAMQRAGGTRISLEEVAPCMLEALQCCAAVLPRYKMAGKTTGEDEELRAVLETVTEAITEAMPALSYPRANPPIPHQENT